jgi:phage terminase large subunit
MAFEVTTAVKKMLRMTARKKVIQGSTSSGKTYGIIPILYDKALEQDRIKITITAETLPALKDGAIDIFKRFMMDEGRWVDERWNATDNVYTCQNKSKLQFKSFDSVGRAKAAGKRDILFINEANHVHWDIADALMIRSKEVWLDFNADEEFWAHTEILKSPDSEFLKLTYLDNEAIPTETFTDLMERKRKAELEEAQGIKGYWWNWWQVYGLGEIGQRQELIYPIFEILKDKPERFSQFVYGIDFGYQHPLAMLKVWFYEDELFVEEVIYKTLVSNIVDEVNKHSLDKEREIIADSARPDLIAELRGAGYYVLKADKAVEKGIDVVRKLKVYLSERALNTISENKNYKYKSINGILSESVDKRNDDAMDALRYAAVYIHDQYLSGSIYDTL